MMRVLTYALLAVETVRRAKARSALSMVGIATGVFAILMLVSVSSAARTYVEGQFALLGVDLIRVLPGKSDAKGMPLMTGGASRPLTLEDIEYVRQRLPKRTDVSAVVLGNTTVKRESKSRGVLGMGVDEPWIDLVHTKTQSGMFFTMDDVRAKRHVCLLGARTARVLFPDEIATGQHVEIFGARFRVIGVLIPKGMSVGVDLDDLVVMPSTVAIDGFGLPGATEVFVRPPRGSPTKTFAADLREVLDARSRDKDYTLVKPDDILAVVGGIMSALSAVVIGIGLISVLVGGIGIANTMLLAVKDRVREIGIRRAIGATGMDILVQFLCESAVISMIGGLIGISLALGVIFSGRLLFQLPLEVDVAVAFASLLFSLLIGVVAGLAPARSAGRLPPLEALRS